MTTPAMMSKESDAQRDDYGAKKVDAAMSAQMMRAASRRRY